NRILVEVVTAGQAVEKLIDLLNGSALSKRDAHPLTVTLNVAAASFDGGNPSAGLNQIDTFQRKVAAQVSPDRPALAQTLSVAARKIIDAFGSAGDPPKSDRFLTPVSRKLPHSDHRHPWTTVLPSSFD